MTDRYQKIRDAVAMGPTPGPWQFARTNSGTFAKSTRLAGYFVEVRQCRTAQSIDADANLIAACDPDTIRALPEERDVLAATLASTEAARDGYRDDARQLHAALVRMVAPYESEFDHEDTHKFRPELLREALALTNALQEVGEGLEIEPETLDAPSTWR